MRPRNVAIVALAAALLALLAVGLVQLAGTSGKLHGYALTPAQLRSRLAGSPPQLAALHAQANRILPGGVPALRARLRLLRGTPIVVNKWASWCGPCRGEFPIFQRVSVSRGHVVAFLGIDSGEQGRGEATAFLRSFPVSYPSYYDPSGQAGLAISNSSNTPVTVFFNRRGEQFTWQGAFPSVAKLEAAIARYALDA